MCPNYIWNVDFFEWVKDQPDQSFDTIITDPPYTSFRNTTGENKIKDRSFNTQQFTKECTRILKPEGLFISFGSILLLKDYFDQFKDRLRFRCEQVWDKRPVRTWVSNSLPLRHLEYIVYFGEGVLDFRDGTIKKKYKRRQFGGMLKSTPKNPNSSAFGQFQQILTTADFPVPKKKRNERKVYPDKAQMKLADFNTMENNAEPKQEPRNLNHPTRKAPEFSLYFKQIVINPGRVLDPCCGTGALICAFDDAIGIDINNWEQVAYKAPPRKKFIGSLDLYRFIK